MRATNGCRLNVNIDHIATIRQARRTFEPSVVAAAVLADMAGASGITIHLRGDRRHIQDDDVTTLRLVVKTHLNIEMAVTDEMISIARSVRPEAATLVPERAEEVTTEGGLDVTSHEQEVSRAVSEIKSAGVLVSIFLDPDTAQIEAAHRVGADQIEICTATYAELTDPTKKADAASVEAEVRRIADSARLAEGLNLQVAAGHGLSYRNVRAIAAIPQIGELNIGHNIVARAALVGMERAVREMIAAINGQLL
ncbi:MAG TPA: pyridoxine 5'-phosphate synthase [Blastocatellia bacterium]|nr:pyridoxine 5'-phosphate synthase [Blastocatellia bacterium]